MNPNPFGSTGNMFANANGNNNHSSELDFFGNRTNKDTMQKDQFFDNHGNNGANDLFAESGIENLFGNSSGNGGIFNQ